MDRKSVMAWLEGLAQDDWRMFHSDSEVQEIARSALELITSDYIHEVAKQFRRPIVLCKDCIHRGDKHKCILAFVADKQDFPYFFYDNRGEWFCADGKHRD
jgi:hypothetical protein